MLDNLSIYQSINLSIYQSCGVKNWITFFLGIINA